MLRGGIDPLSQPISNFKPNAAALLRLYWTGLIHFDIMWRSTDDLWHGAWPAWCYQLLA